MRILVITALILAGCATPGPPSASHPPIVGWTTTWTAEGQDLRLFALITPEPGSVCQLAARAEGTGSGGPIHFFAHSDSYLSPYSSIVAASSSGLAGQPVLSANGPWRATNNATIDSTGLIVIDGASRATILLTCPQPNATIFRGTSVNTFRAANLDRAALTTPNGILVHGSYRATSEDERMAFRLFIATPADAHLTVQTPSATLDRQLDDPTLISHNGTSGPVTVNIEGTLRGDFYGLLLGGHLAANLESGWSRSAP